MQSSELKDLVFPVYRLGTRCPEVLDGVVFYTYRRENGFDIRIVDDRNKSESSLAKRRIQVIVEGGKIFRISTSIFFISDLIKIATPNTWFIDSSGRLFRYKKSKTVKLLFRKIKAVHKIVSGALIEVDGIPSRFKSLFPPMDDQHWAGLLKLSAHSYILYGFYDKQYKDTVRKV